MEWGVDMHSKLHIYPRNMARVSSYALLSGYKRSPGANWVSRYGYIAVDCYRDDITIDGMNEKGLSVGGLWFPGAIYPQVPGAQHKAKLNVLQLTDWMLSNFVLWTM